MSYILNNIYPSSRADVIQPVIGIHVNKSSKTSTVVCNAHWFHDIGVVEVQIHFIVMCVANELSRNYVGETIRLLQRYVYINDLVQYDYR